MPAVAFAKAGNRRSQFKPDDGRIRLRARLRLRIRSRPESVAPRERLRKPSVDSPAVPDRKPRARSRLVCGIDSRQPNGVGKRPRGNDKESGRTAGAAKVQAVCSPKALLAKAGGYIPREYTLKEYSRRAHGKGAHAIVQGKRTRPGARRKSRRFAATRPFPRKRVAIFCGSIL